MTDLVKQITGDLQKQIESFEPQYEISDIGKVLEAGDGIARVEGLARVQAQELVQFSNGVMGTAFNLEKESVGVIVMGDYSGITEGMIVRGTGRIASVPVGDALIGRVVNALDRKCNEALAATLQEDMAAGTEIRWEDFRRRHLLERILERLAYGLRHWL